MCFRLEDFNDVPKGGECVLSQRTDGFVTYGLSAGDEVIIEGGRTNYVLALWEGSGVAIYSRNGVNVSGDTQFTPPVKQNLTLWQNKMYHCVRVKWLSSSQATSFFSVPHRELASCCLLSALCRKFLKKKITFKISKKKEMR